MNGPTYVRGLGGFMGRDATEYFSSGNHVFYKTCSFVASNSGNQTFTITEALTRSGFEYTHMALYQIDFNPDSPATNFLLGGEGLPSLSHTLVAGRRYFVVLSPYFEGDTDTFTLTSTANVFPKNSGIPNSAIAETTTFYVANSESFSCRIPVSFTINSLPTATANSNSPICTGTSLNLTGGGGSTYSWSGPMSFTSTDQSPTITNTTVAASGVYILNGTDANSCTSTVTTSVIVNTKPNAPTINAPTEKVVCSPSTLVLTSSGCAGTVTWSQGGATGSNLTLSTVGTYSITATCTVNGCTSDASSSLTGLEIKAKPTAVASNTGPYTAGQNIVLNGTDGSGTSPESYAWTGPNGFTSSISNPTIANATSANSGIYYLTVTTNGCSATASTIVVLGISMPSFTGTEFCAGSDLTISFSTSSTFNVGNQFQVQLSDADGNFNSPQIISTTTVAGSVICNIPSTTVGGENYRIKVVSTDPVESGSNSSVALTVNPLIYNLVSLTNDYTSGTANKKVVNTINASNKIISPANVLYQAGKSVLLTPGFVSSSVFRAEVKSCDN